MKQHRGTVKQNKDIFQLYSINQHGSDLLRSNPSDLCAAAAAHAPRDISGASLAVAVRLGDLSRLRHCSVTVRQVPVTVQSRWDRRASRCSHELGSNDLRSQIPAGGRRVASICFNRYKLPFVYDRISQRLKVLLS